MVPCGRFLKVVTVNGHDTAIGSDSFATNGAVIWSSSLPVKLSDAGLKVSVTVLVVPAASEMVPELPGVPSDRSQSYFRLLTAWSDVSEPVRVKVGGVLPHATLSGEAGELLSETVMFA
jgi:hypothetical protein